MAPQVGGVPDFVDALRRRWLLALLVAVPLLAGVVGYAQSLPNDYTSEAVVSFTPKADSNVSGDTIRIVLPKYIASVTSPQTIRAAAARTTLSSGDVQNAVDASIPPDTTNLEISVKLHDPRQAQAVADYLTSAVLSAASTDQLLAADVSASAIVPSDPSGPNRKLIDVVGLALAVLLGILTAFLVERGSPRIQHAEDVVELTGQPVVGRIPRSRRARVDPIEALNSDPAMGGAVRNLRLYLDAELRSQPLQTLAITSPTAGDGKTTVAIALAAAIARLDAKVLLVDADLRRPRVASSFGLATDRHLGEVLRRHRSLDECVQPGPVPGLSVVVGTVIDDVGDLLARSFADVMAQARVAFDVIVVDCPPLLGSEDATTLTSMVDGCLMVVSHGAAANVVHQASIQLEVLPVRMLGVVLNRARDLVSGYSATYYSRATRPPDPRRLAR